MKREEPPIEFELNADELLALSRPRPITTPITDPAQFHALPAKAKVSPHAQTVAVCPAIAARNIQRPAALVLSAVAAVLIGAVGYLSSSAELHEAVATASRAAAPVAQPSAPARVQLPVRFANPFDQTEVFEFPPGTSKAEARERVADMLIQRARDRQHQYERIAAVRRARATAR